MGRAGTARRAFWETDRSAITETQMLGEGRAKAAALAKAEREIAFSGITRGLRNAAHVRYVTPWKPFSVKTPTHQKKFLLCTFCGAPPPQHRGATMKGWWHRTLPAPGNTFPSRQEACPTCKKALDKGRDLHPVL